MPSDVTRQLEQAHHGVLVAPAPTLATLVVTGRDTKTWLNGLVTCDLAPTRDGDGRFGLKVTRQGKLEAELWILVGRDAALVAVPRERLDALYVDLDKHLVMERAELAAEPDAYAWTLLYGPRSGELVDVATARGARAARVDRAGLGGGVVACPSDEREALLAALCEAAGDAAVASEEGLAQLELELGIGRFGVDYGEDCYPQEAGLETVAVSFNKGCYLGQEAVFMLQNRGHEKRRLALLEVEGQGAPARDATIAAPDGAEAGRVTRGGVRLADGVALALGLVKHKHLEIGAALRVDGRPARLVRVAGK